MDLETGKTYKVSHSRKGVFVVKITNQCETWAYGTVVSGKANAMLDYNEAHPGDDVGMRKSHILRAEAVQHECI